MSLETTFLIDLRRGSPAAVARAKAIEESGEVRCVTAPVAAELLAGAYRFGGTHLDRTCKLLGSLVLLPTDLECCEEAGRLSADLLARGGTLGGTDLLIAAITKRHGDRLLTRDRSFARVPGLVVETY